VHVQQQGQQPQLPQAHLLASRQLLLPQCIPLPAVVRPLQLLVLRLLNHRLLLPQRLPHWHTLPLAVHLLLPLMPLLLPQLSHHRLWPALNVLQLHLTQLLLQDLLLQLLQVQYPPAAARAVDLQPLEQTHPQLQQPQVQEQSLVHVLPPQLALVRLLDQQQHRQQHQKCWQQLPLHHCWPCAVL
jgi:hypothetical protein